MIDRVRAVKEQKTRMSNLAFRRETRMPEAATTGTTARLRLVRVSVGNTYVRRRDGRDSLVAEYMVYSFVHILETLGLGVHRH